MGPASQSIRLHETIQFERFGTIVARGVASDASDPSEPKRGRQKRLDGEVGCPVRANASGGGPAVRRDLSVFAEQ